MERSGTFAGRRATYKSGLSSEKAFRGRKDATEKLRKEKREEKVQEKRSHARALKVLRDDPSKIIESATVVFPVPPPVSIEVFNASICAIPGNLGDLTLVNNILSRIQDTCDDITLAEVIDRAIVVMAPVMLQFLNTILDVCMSSVNLTRERQHYVHSSMWMVGDLYSSSSMPEELYSSEVSGIIVAIMSTMMKMDGSIGVSLMLEETVWVAANMAGDTRAFSPWESTLVKGAEAPSTIAGILAVIQSNAAHILPVRSTACWAMSNICIHPDVTLENFITLMQFIRVWTPKLDPKCQFEIAWSPRHLIENLQPEIENYEERISVVASECVRILLENYKLAPKWINATIQAINDAVVSGDHYGIGFKVASALMGAPGGITPIVRQIATYRPTDVSARKFAITASRFISMLIGNLMSSAGARDIMAMDQELMTLLSDIVSGKIGSEYNMRNHCFCAICYAVVNESDEPSDKFVEMALRCNVASSIVIYVNGMSSLSNSAIDIGKTAMLIMMRTDGDGMAEQIAPLDIDKFGSVLFSAVNVDGVDEFLSFMTSHDQEVIADAVEIPAAGNPFASVVAPPFGAHVIPPFNPSNPF